MGCVLPANLGQAPARQASIAAGLPLSAGATGRMPEIRPGSAGGR